jgi:glycosyltransferase involved in cell wall biosynthesis
VSDLPTVSAVIATRDRPTLLRRAVAAVLAQDYAGPIECVVVYDGGPVDPLADVVVREGRTLVTMTNTRTPGLAGARNTGAAAATGAYLGFCDDDDWWHATKISVQMETVHRTGCEVTVTGVEIAFDDRITTRVPPALVTRDLLLRGRGAEVHPSTVLVAAAAFRSAIGPVDEAIPGSYGEDYEWLLRAAAAAGPVVGVPRALVTVQWGSSLFADRWQTMVDAIGYLTTMHPELLDDNANAARLFGRVAFAYAAMRRRRAAARWAWRSVRRRPLERRPYLALAVASGLVRASTIQRRANRVGHGV